MGLVMGLVVGLDFEAKMDSSHDVTSCRDQSQTLVPLCVPTLKGHCHEDFAVLGQFCAKIITLRL